MDTLATLVDRLTTTARDVLLRDGHHVATLLLFGNEEKAAVIALNMPLGDVGAEREATFRQLGEHLGNQLQHELGSLEAVLHVSEAWRRTVAHGETRQYAHLENDPQREEVLVITAYSPRSHETLFVSLAMHRDSEGTLIAVDETATPLRGGRAYLLEAFCAGWA